MSTDVKTEGRYTIASFLQATAQQDRGQGFFELENPRTLEVNLDNNMVWTKAGAMVAYNGTIRFEREGMLEHGIGMALKKAFSGEATALMKASGIGKLYLADAGKKIFIINLQNEGLVVNGNDLLAFEADDKIKWDIRRMKLSSAMAAGNLTNIYLEGTGMIAFTTHYEPVTLKVTPATPVFTDPNATVAWSGNLMPEPHLDVTLKSFLGRGSGESVQLKFQGDGFVVVQPYEEVYYYPTAE